MAGNLRMLKLVKTNYSFKSSPAASDFGIKRHRDAIFRPRELAIGNNWHELCEYFLRLRIFSVASVTSEL